MISPNARSLADIDLTDANRLQESGVLVPTRIGRRRDREWISDDLFQLLDEFELDLGECQGIGQG